MGKNLKELSKNEFGPTGVSPTIDQINCGSLQRIADATEKMATGYIQMERDLKWYKQKFEEVSKTRNALERKISSMKGVITKLKNKQFDGLS